MMVNLTTNIHVPCFKSTCIIEDQTRIDLVMSSESRPRSWSMEDDKDAFVMVQKDELQLKNPEDCDGFCLWQKGIQTSS